MTRRVLLVSALVCFSFSALTSVSASDKLAGGIKAGSTSISLPIELRKSSDSTSLTGIVYTGVTASYWRQGSTRTAITTATLGSVNAAYSSGGFVEVDATNMPGVYRFDVPDAAFATGADWVVVSLKVSSAFQQTFMFALESVGSAETYSRIGAPAGASIAADIATRSTYAGADTSGTTTLLSRITGTLPLASDYTSARAAKLDNLDATLSSRGTSTLTQAQVTGGAYALNTDGSGNVKVSSGTGANQISLTSGTVTFANTSIGTVTTLTNLPSIPAGWLTASGIAAGALNGKGDWLLASAYTAAPTSTANAAAVWRDLTAGSDFLFSGGAGALMQGLSDKLSALPSAAQILDASLSGHNTAGTVGASLTSAGNAGDPWATLVPGSYGAGTAGNIFGKFIVPNYTGPVVTVPSPNAPSQSVGYIVTRDAQGAAQAGVKITFALQSAPGADSYSVSTFTATSASDGTLSVNLRQGALYTAQRGNGRTARFTVPNTDSFALPQLLGNP